MEAVLISILTQKSGILQGFASQTVYLKELSDERERSYVAHQCDFWVCASLACDCWIIDTSLNS